MTDSFKYQGGELVLFQYAITGRNTFPTDHSIYDGNVLETGAIGATTLLLNNGCYAKWLLLEPDREMSKILDKKISEKELPANCKLQTGTIDQLTEIFDTILYIDVLEHIESDKEEIKKAAALLSNGEPLNCTFASFSIPL